MKGNYRIRIPPEQITQVENVKAQFLKQSQTMCKSTFSHTSR